MTFFNACANGRLLEVQKALREASDAQTHTLLDQDEFIMHPKNPSKTIYWDVEFKPLHVAAMKGHGDVVKLLVDKGANLHAQDPAYGRTALHWAAEEGHGEVVKLLVDKGANLDVQDHMGRTALRLVADQPNGALMVLLLKASVGNKNTPPEMVFYSAAYYAHLADNFGSLADYMLDTKRDEEVEVAKDVLLVFLILIDSISVFKFNDAQFSKLSRIFAESLQTTIIQSDYISKPLAILALLAGALGNRARQRPQVRDDLLALRSKVVQLTLAALSVPEMDEKDAALNAMGYSNEDIATGNFISMTKFASCEDALAAPFHFLVTQRAADIIAAPQLQSSLDKIFYRNRVGCFKSEICMFYELNCNLTIPGRFIGALIDAPIKNEWNFQDWRTLPRLFFLSQAFFHCLYLGSTILVTCYPERFSWSKDVLIWMTVGYSVEEINQLFTNSAATRYINDPWNFLDSAFLLIFFIWLVTGKDTLLAVNLFVLPFRLLRYLSIFRSSGILVAVLFRMITATANFLVFYATILLGFSGMMTVFYAEKDEFEFLPTSCLTLFDASLGNYDFTIFMGDDNEGDDWLGIGLLIVFLLLSTVMILNLLIAVLSEEYSQLSEHSYQQWCLMYADIVQENTVSASKFPDNLRLPAPLSLLSHISYFVLLLTKLVGQRRASYGGATSKSEAISKSEDIKNPIITPVAQPDTKTEAGCSRVAVNKLTEPNTIMKWVVIFVTLLTDVTVHLVVGLPWALTSLYISGFRDLGFFYANRHNLGYTDLPIYALVVLSLIMCLWLLIGIPFLSIFSFIWWTPSASFEAWKKCTKTNKSVGEKKESVWLESMQEAVKKCAMTEDGNETSQVLSEVSNVKAEVKAQVGELKAQMEAQVGELKAQVEAQGGELKAQGGELKAMMARLLEAQGLATPTPAMEESVTKEEGAGTGGLASSAAPAGVGETKSS